jgi:hypothetical protein
MLEIIEIRSFDHTLLKGIGYFSKGKCLTILSCSPYRNFENTKDIQSFGKFLSTIPAHYVYMDVRGTGESEGNASNEYSQNELKDTNEIIKYIRSQAWSNGSIMMHGISYSAFNALQACSLSNGPNFLFIMHVSNDRWNNDVHYFGGIKTIMEDINYGFATTGQNLLPCYTCNHSQIKDIDTPWYMKWFKQGHKENKEWSYGFIEHPNESKKNTTLKKKSKKILPPTFLICGWRDSYSPSAVKLSNIVSFTFIGPFGHTYPKDHNKLIKQWIDVNHNKLSMPNKIINYNGPLCIIIPTPRSLWNLGYYQIKAYHRPNYKVLFKCKERIRLEPDLVGDSLEIYSSGDMVYTPSLDLVRKDLKRNLFWGYEKEIIIENTGVWGEPELILNCLQYEKGDYMVARLTTNIGETLSVGVARIESKTIRMKLKPFFIPVNTYKIHLFLNRSWIPVLFPTMNKNTILLDSIQLSLPFIGIEDYYKLNKYASETEMELLKDVSIKKITKKKNKLIYETISKYPDGSFSEKVKLSFVLCEKTKVMVENNYVQNNNLQPNILQRKYIEKNNLDQTHLNQTYKIKTLTEIENTETDVFDVKIRSYNNNKFIKKWEDHFVVNNDNILFPTCV